MTISLSLSLSLSTANYYSRSLRPRPSGARRHTTPSIRRPRRQNSAANDKRLRHRAVRPRVRRVQRVVALEPNVALGDIVRLPSAPLVARLDAVRTHRDDALAHRLGGVRRRAADYDLPWPRSPPQLCEVVRNENVPTAAGTIREREREKCVCERKRGERRACREQRVDVRLARRIH